MLNRSVSILEQGNGTKIMTYNVLAQSLVRRDQYPTSGNFLRWAQRSKSFAREIDAYNPDILLIQEVDADHRKFWRDLLETRGMHCIFHQHVTKKHGLAICFKTAKFVLVQTSNLDIDLAQTPGIPLQCKTGNVALFAQLQSRKTAKTMLLGTAHLYWHPDASYERSRQLLCILNEIEKIRKDGEPVVFGGDCNTEYFDPPYLLATGNKLDARAVEIMQKSLKATSFDKAGAVEIVDGVASTLALDAGAVNAKPNLIAGIPGLEERLKKSFQDHKLVYDSFYKRYGQTGREAAECGEPLYTNWTEVFKGTLDYLMGVYDKRLGSELRVISLLNIPTRQEIGSGGLPKLGWSPSDHICVMAEVSFT